jgi:hypothetical protein
VHHINIPIHAAPAAPDWLLGASTGVKGAFLPADGALCHFFFSFFSFFLFFFADWILIVPPPTTHPPRPLLARV